MGWFTFGLYVAFRDGFRVGANRRVRPHRESAVADYPPVFRTTWLSGYCYWLWPKACLFKVVRAFVPQIGMPSVAIVPSLDPSKDVLYC